MSTKPSNNDSSDLDKLSPEQLGKLFPITVKAYNSDWLSFFQNEKSEIKKILGDKAIRIEHFGSTAIPSIQSKPIIDILVEIPNDPITKKEAVNEMISNGYHFILRTDRTPPHMMFLKGYTTKGFSKQVYHIHIAEKENQELWDRLCFRDYLINNEEVAREYEALKLRLVKEFKHDREAYTSGKDQFVGRVTKLAKQAPRLR